MRTIGAILLRALVRLRHDQTGQGLIFGAFSGLLLVFCIVLCWNIGNITSQKIRAQNAVDAAVYSGAMVEANSVSTIAWLNNIMAFVYAHMVIHVRDVMFFGCPATLKELGEATKDNGGWPPFEGEGTSELYRQRIEEIKAKSAIFEKDICPKEPTPDSTVDQIVRARGWLAKLLDLEWTVAAVTPDLVKREIAGVLKRNLVGMPYVWAMYPDVTLSAAGGPLLEFAPDRNGGERPRALLEFDSMGRFWPQAREYFRFASLPDLPSLDNKVPWTALPQDLVAQSVSLQDYVNYLTWDREKWFDPVRGMTTREDLRQPNRDDTYWCTSICWNRNDWTHSNCEGHVNATEWHNSFSVFKWQGPPWAHWHEPAEHTHQGSTPLQPPCDGRFPTHMCGHHKTVPGEVDKFPRHHAEHPCSTCNAPCPVCSGRHGPNERTDTWEGKPTVRTYVADLVEHLRRRKPPYAFEATVYRTWSKKAPSQFMPGATEDLLEGRSGTRDQIKAPALMMTPDAVNFGLTVAICVLGSHIPWPVGGADRVSPVYLAIASAKLGFWEGPGSETASGRMLYSDGANIVPSSMPRPPNPPSTRTWCDSGANLFTTRWGARLVPVDIVAEGRMPAGQLWRGLTGASWLDGDGKTQPFNTDPFKPTTSILGPDLLRSGSDPEGKGSSTHH